MTREDKKKKKILRAQRRRCKNRERSADKPRRYGGLDCPYDVDMNNSYGTCDCNHENYNTCMGDI